MINRKRRHVLVSPLLWALVLALCPVLWGSARATDFTFPMHDRRAIPLGEVEISGNTHTADSVILRILGFHTGQMISRQDIDEAWDRLEDCGYFRTVDVNLDDSGDDAVLEVVVEEDLQTFYGPVIRYDRRHKYLRGAYLEQRNFRGHGETLRLEAAALYAQQANLVWDRPWFLGRTGLSARLEAGFRQGDFVYRPTRFRRWDATASLRHQWHTFFVSAGMTYGRFQQRDGYTWPAPWRGSASAAPDEYLPAATETHWVFTGAVGLDSRSNPYYPRRGVYLEGRLRSWISDDFDSYLESTLDGRLFVPLPWMHHILALHAWGRSTDGPAQLDNRLYFGGPETVRGEPYALREGDEGYLLSAEYRIPLFLMPISPQGELVGVGIHLFADAGDAWYDGADPGHALQSAGAGLHLNLDTLQLRFEAARTREGHWGFEFMDRFNF